MLNLILSSFNIGHVETVQIIDYLQTRDQRQN